MGYIDGYNCSVIVEQLCYVQSYKSRDFLNILLKVLLRSLITR